MTIDSYDPMESIILHPSQALCHITQRRHDHWSRGKLLDPNGGQFVVITTADTNETLRIVVITF